ncbi:MAG TPA: tRNA pseudouridine(55) synthase TruB [Candidatus Dormibacteraeota bacterium]|nr:tRNA pseudouridine(55) synthase TruB [Candidatus Dormibacteraeota bacterium]
MNETVTAPPTRRARPPARHHGIVPLNKARGVTSFQAVREVRRILGERRVGHAGTLDPAATGLLPICVGQATRLVDYLHQQPKRYHCVLRLGERSTTMDLEGEVSRGGDAGAIDAAAVREALARFVGDIEQVPPMHSAVRHDGRHLYELARQGMDVERQPRPVTILEARLLEFRAGEVAEAEVDVLCGKGTYMRVLASDVGDALGTGGLLAWLERTAYGPMTVADSITVEQLEAMDDPAGALRPLDLAVTFLPRLDLGPAQALQVQRGQSVWVPRLPDPRPRGACRAHSALGDLLAVGELQGNLYRPTKVMAGC